MKIEEIITDEQMIKAFGHSNFGNWKPREVLADTVLKYASGYQTGHTAKIIGLELGLITQKGTLTKKGKEYLYESFAYTIQKK
jgi:hypothetical protein